MSTRTITPACATYTHSQVAALYGVHRDASLVWKRYGRYVPEAIDYRADPEADSATDLATPQLQKKQS